jgi:ribonucleotide reductase beta subunit family protein with ferritin-like domain
MQSETKQVEYLLKENPNRFVIFPIKHNDLWEAFQSHRKAIWFEHEIDLVPDLAHWQKLNEGEQYFIKHVLAFFAASDGIIMENLGVRFFDEIQIPEARAF